MRLWPRRKPPITCSWAIRPNPITHKLEGVGPVWQVWQTESNLLEPMQIEKLKGGNIKDISEAIRELGNDVAALVYVYEELTPSLPEELCQYKNAVRQAVADKLVSMLDELTDSTALWLLIASTYVSQENSELAYTRFKALDS